MDYNKVLNFIDSAKQQGYSDAEISEFVKSKGVKIEDVQKAYASKQPKSQEGGFLQKVVQGITSLPSRFGATIAAQGADLGSFADSALSGFKTMDFSKGDKIRQEGLDLGYLGNAKPIGGDINNQTFGGLAKDVAGTTLQAGLDAATLGGGGALMGAGEGAAKAGIGALAKQGAKEGAVLGAGYGLSNSLQSDEDWAHTALNTILGAVGGGVVGGAAGVAVPKISSALSTIKGNIAENGVIKGIDKSFLGAVDGIIKNKSASSKPLLNVGLNIGNETKLNEQIITDTLKKEFGVDVLGGKIVQSGTEPTFVPELSRKLTDKELNRLSEVLEQDAIPQYADGVGMMAGPKAKEWGDFNPDYFLNKEGKPISSIGETINIKIPKNVNKGLNAAGDVLEELEGMKQLDIDPTNVEQRNALLQTIKDGKFDFKEINVGGEKQIDFTPTVENLSKETKAIAESQDELIRSKYNKSYDKKELASVIQEKRNTGIKEYGTPNTKDFQKALEKQIQNYQLNKMTSATEILSKIRSIKFDETADSATRQATNDIKTALTDLLKKDFPGFAEKNDQMHRNFLVLDVFGKGLAKPGQSIQEKIASVGAALLAAPQGIVASFLARSTTAKVFRKLFGGVYSLESAKKEFLKEAAPLVDEWVAKGVSKDNIFKLMQEKYAYGKPSPELVHDIVMELQDSASKIVQDGTEQAAKKLADNKSLIRIIKGLGTDAQAIKEELVSQGINVSDIDAKTFAALNKNSGKSITPYLEKLAKVGLIKGTENEIME